jgi:hypothetical protein
MIINPSATIFNTVVFFILIIVGFAIFKPNFLYDNDAQKFRNFGYGEGKTIFALPVMGVICAVTVYFLFSSIETINNFAHPHK